MNVLVAAALVDEIKPLQEARAFPSRAGVVTGPGKVNATTHLMATLASAKYDLVINLGTCGRLNKALPTFEPIEVGLLYQWDTDLHLLGDGWNTTIKVTDRSRVVLATGDRFVDAASQDIMDLQAYGVDLVDMEAYAMARACRMWGVDFRCVKVATDDGDLEAWREHLPRAADVLKEWFLANVA